MLFFKSNGRMIFPKKLSANYFGLRYKQTPNISNKHEVTLVTNSIYDKRNTNSIIEIFNAAKCPIHFDVINQFSFDSFSDRKALRKNQAILLCNPERKGEYSVPNSPYYKYLGLYIKVIHNYNMQNVQTKYKNVDFVIIRHNLEGEDSGIEYQPIPDVYQTIRVLTKKETYKIAKEAFEYVSKNNRKKITCVHNFKAMPLSNKLFVDTCNEVAQDYPNIEFSSMNIHRATVQLINNPKQFDSILLTNMYGLLYAAIAAGLAGGDSMSAGANYGPEYMLFEAGTRYNRQYFDLGVKFNPTAIIMAGANMLKSMGLSNYGTLIDDSVKNVYKKGERLPFDVGGRANVKEFTKEVTDEIERNLSNY